MADRCKEHPWGTCDGCGADLGGIGCTNPHSFGDYDTLCHGCFRQMKERADKKAIQRDVNGEIIPASDLGADDYQALRDVENLADRAQRGG